MFKRTIARYALSLFLSSGMVLQATSPSFAFPLGNLTTQQEIALGRQAAAEVEQQLPLVRDSSIQTYIQRLGARLARHSGRTNVPYRFRVINRQDANAFALPGGFIYVNRGLIQLARNESELAGVLAHEIGHVAERHSIEQLKKAQAFGLGLGILDLLMGRSRSTAEQIGSVAANLLAQGVFFKYSRDAEREADRVAVSILRRAGISPNGMVTLFQRMDQNRGSRLVNPFFSSHPSLRERRSNISGMLRSRDQGLTRDSVAFRRTKDELGGDLLKG